jgi:hypothetical protein
MNRIEYPAGTSQTIVAFVSDDSGGEVEAGELIATLAADMEQHERDGWRVLSTFGLPLRQMGTAGNILFQSGGQYVTQAAVAVVYARA